MREILFRGKRQDNGEWVFGCFGQHTTLDAFIIKKPYPDVRGEISALGFWSVEPATVGQYTGLTDRNGVKIFEMDIARFKRFGTRYIGKIIYNQKTAGFELLWNTIVGAYGEKATHCANLSVSEDIEVIGNIHDNPERLEDGETND